MAFNYNTPHYLTTPNGDGAYIYKSGVSIPVTGSAYTTEPTDVNAVLQATGTGAATTTIKAKAPFNVLIYAAPILPGTNGVYAYDNDIRTLMYAILNSLSTAWSNSEPATLMSVSDSTTMVDKDTIRRTFDLKNDLTGYKVIADSNSVDLKGLTTKSVDLRTSYAELLPLTAVVLVKSK